MFGNLYFLSGVVNNIGLLAINRMYTNASALAIMSPTVFSIESQMLIQVWGLAYISVAKKWKQVPLLSLVFAFEKFLYSYWWLLWIKDEVNRNMAVNMVKSGVLGDMVTGGFFLTYGVNDLLFGLVFLAGAVQGFVNSAEKSKSKSSKAP